MYLHVFKCKECRHYQTYVCPWQRTKEDNMAGTCFCSKIETISGSGTVPISGFGLSLVSTAVSAGGPIEVGE